MQTFAVDLALLRDVLLPGVRVAPGRALMARVVAAESGRGSLSVAGYLIEAELPAHVRAGQDLRLEVRDISAGRVLLQIAGPGHAAPPPPPAEVPLPGGGSLTVTERDAQGDGGASGAGSGAGSHSLALRYDAPALGPVDLRFELTPGSMRVGVTVSPGDSLHRAQADADTLRAALAGALGHAVSVTISPRREPIDVYA
ncbi:MAG TPA: hypothetical protein VHW04_23220 [Solirubrobacteraceae bacterium]|jgi:hypothetical protein|nr:hypothetical protein [Solirubrobacteraceae bacterium]